MERVYRAWSLVNSLLILGLVITAIGLIILGMVGMNIGSWGGLVLPGICIQLMSCVLLEAITIGPAMGRKYNVPVRSLKLKTAVGDLPEDSILYRQGLRSGDVVVRVNNDELQDTFPLSTWWQNEDSVTLTILRNSQELQVTLRKE